MAIRIFSLVILSIMVMSCHSNEAKKIVLSMIDKNVDFNCSDLSLKYEGRDTIITNYLSGNKLLILIDSIGCSSCKLKNLNNWMPYIDTLKKYNITPVFIISTTNNKSEDVDISLKVIDFSYPIYVSYNSEFLKKNQFIPANPLFHVFLLDSNNNVVVVGDPMWNSEIWQLYVTEFNELNLFSDSTQ